MDFPTRSWKNSRLVGYQSKFTVPWVCMAMCSSLLFRQRQGIPILYDWESGYPNLSEIFRFGQVSQVVCCRSDFTSRNGDFFKATVFEPDVALTSDFEWQNVVKSCQSSEQQVRYCSLWFGGLAFAQRSLHPDHEENLAIWLRMVSASKPTSLEREVGKSMLSL